jgi:hypothetical protein
MRRRRWCRLREPWRLGRRSSSCHRLGRRRPAAAVPGRRRSVRVRVGVQVAVGIDRRSTATTSSTASTAARWDLRCHRLHTRARLDAASVRRPAPQRFGTLALQQRLFPLRYMERPSSVADAFPSAAAVTRRLHCRWQSRRLFKFDAPGRSEITFDQTLRRRRHVTDRMGVQD